MEKDIKKIIEIGMHGKHYEALEMLKQKPLEEDVFEELNELRSSELDGLLGICSILTYNALPIEALTDNEKRMAYCLWKSEVEKEKLESTKTFSFNLLRIMKFWKSILERDIL